MELSREVAELVDADDLSIVHRKSLAVPSAVLVVVLLILSIGSILVVFAMQESQRQAQRTTVVITNYLDVQGALGVLAVAETEANLAPGPATSAALDRADENLAGTIAKVQATLDPVDTRTAPELATLYDEYTRVAVAPDSGIAASDSVIKQMMTATEQAIASRRGTNTRARLHQQHLTTILTWLIPSTSLAGMVSLFACWRVLLRSHDQLAVRAALGEYGALRDPLTGLHNRRSFDAQIEAVESAQERVAVVVIDLDHFKEVNDNYGHARGDYVLIEVARALRGQVRPQDVVARIGGDEFVVILHDAADARIVADRLRLAVLDVAVLTNTRVSASVGVAEVEGRTASSALALADRAVYRAKRAGRDAVFVA